MHWFNEDILTDKNPFYIEYKCIHEKSNNHLLCKHNFIQLLYVTDGELKIYADYKYYNLKSGNVIFINSGTPYSVFDAEKNTKFYYICFLPEIVHSYGEDFFNAIFFFWIKSAIDSKVYLLNIDENSFEASLIADAYKAYIKKDFAFEFSLLSKVLLLCVQFFKKNYIEAKKFLPKVANSDTITIKKVLGEIENNFPAPSLSELATNYNIPATLLAKQFHETLGCSSSKYIEYHRIYQAMFMLATGAAKITDIAYSVGFTDSAYFSKLFFRYTGFTPSAFRKNQRSQSPSEVYLSTKLLKDKTPSETDERLFYNSIFLGNYYENKEWGASYDFFEIIYVDIGKTNIELENEHYVMSPGDILIICPNEKSRIKFIDKKETWFFHIQFYPDILNIGFGKSVYSDKLYDYVKTKKRLFSLADSDADILSSLVSLYSERDKFEPSSEIIARAHILNIVAWILNKQHSIFSDSEQKKENQKLIKLKEIIKYVDTHYTENLSLKEIADKYDISYSHLSREFHELVGFNFNRYINRKRLIKARFFLATTNYSVNEIASSLGFCSSSRFIEKFTASFSLSPLEFRNKFKAKGSLREGHRFFYQKFFR